MEGGFEALVVAVASLGLDEDGLSTYPRLRASCISEELSGFRGKSKGGGMLDGSRAAEVGLGSRGGVAVGQYVVEYGSMDD